ncbi:hypothetical protein FS749_016671 [Ceratobasidium sp. UAMH 11750]|nr:hypothetical protein FS749_016671 [Ceratobasidium sp. UAMH 11750]
MVVIQSKPKPSVRRQAPHAPRRRVSKTTTLNTSVGVRMALQKRKDLTTGATQLMALIDGLIKSKASSLSIKESALRAQLY